MNRNDDMDAMAPPVIGVSPAYFISRFGDRFSARQMTEDLENIEIICPPEHCRAEYAQTRDFIAIHIETAAAGIPAQ